MKTIEHIAIRVFWMLTFVFCILFWIFVIKNAHYYLTALGVLR